MSGFLSDGWRDGFELAGLIGTLATLVSLWIAFRQLRQAKLASEAAQLAIEKTLDAVRSEFAQYILAVGKRLLNEARNFVDNGEWHGAALRSADLAEQASQMAQAYPMDREKWLSAAAEFRKWESTWRRIQIGKSNPKGSLAKWRLHTSAISMNFDQHHGPPSLQARVTNAK